MKERDQRRKIEEAEREYEEHLKDWEYGEREKEKQRQYEKESDKEKLKHLLKGRAKLEVYCAFTPANYSFCSPVYLSCFIEGGKKTGPGEAASKYQKNKILR